MTRFQLHPGSVPGLGRGLGSLLGEGTQGKAGDGTRTLSLDQIEPDPDQPRRHFDKEALDELAWSITERGVIQPLIVRPHGNRFRIVAGERRWRASKIAGVREVPVVVRELTDAQVFELALIENIQRADLNPMEEAHAYRRLIDQYRHNQATLAKVVGKSRSHVANLLRLLDLPEPVRAMVEDGRLTMGHARAVLSAEDPMAAAEAAVADNLSVRDTEARMRAAKPPKTARPAAPIPAPIPGPPPAPAGSSEMAADLAALGRQLGDQLGLSVRVTNAGGRGEVVLAYDDLEQLDLICQRLSGGV